MPQQSLVEERPAFARRRWDRARLLYCSFWGGQLIGLLFVAYTLSYGLWIWVAFKYNVSDDYAWIQNDFYGPLHWLSARSEWYHKVTASLFLWGYGSD